MKKHYLPALIAISATFNSLIIYKPGFP